jgi:hypothetical protein
MLLSRASRGLIASIVLLVLTACSPEPAETGSPSVTILTHPNLGTQEYCFGIVLAGLRVEFPAPGPQVGHVVDSSGRVVDARAYRLLWPEGYTMGWPDGIPEIRDRVGNSVARHGTILRDVEVCRMKEDIWIFDPPVNQ